MNAKEKYFILDELQEVEKKIDEVTRNKSEHPNYIEKISTLYGRQYSLKLIISKFRNGELL